MKQKPATFFIIISFVFYLSSSALASANDNKNDSLQGSLLAQNNPTYAPITYTPLFNKHKPHKTFRFPSAYGVGIEAFGYSQPAITKQLYLENKKIKAHSDSLDQDITSGENRIMIKPEIWVLPFLNIYGLFGYAQGNVTPDIVANGVILEIPFQDTVYEVTLDTSITINEPMRYHGTVYGFGITAFYDYNHFFIEMDYNYTAVKAEDMDEMLISHRITPKGGYLFSSKNGKNEGAVWLGASWLNNTQTLTGLINVREYVGDLADYLGEEADYTSTLTPVYKWNMVAGGSFTFNKHFNIALEVGFLGRKKLLWDFYTGFKFKISGLTFGFLCQIN